MGSGSTALRGIRHRQIEVEGLSLHAADCGALDGSGILFLHGWPEDWSTFERVMSALGDTHHLVSLDLPGIGLSEDVPPSNDKCTLARLVRGAIAALELHDVTLVGHDVGGMIAYAYLHAFPDDLARAVLMNIAVPGVDPWSEVERNPYIWHFAFHSVPELPELLVGDHVARYFDFFYDVLTSTPEGVSTDARAAYVRAYSRPAALHTGFEWYRAFAQDEKDNIAVKDQPVRTPVLYLRGDRERGDIEVYLSGFRAGGLQDLRGEIIAGSGHFAPEEQPEAVAAALKRFIAATYR